MLGQGFLLQYFQMGISSMLSCFQNQADTMIGSYWTSPFDLETGLSLDLNTTIPATYGPTSSTSGEYPTWS